MKLITTAASGAVSLVIRFYRFAVSPLKPPCCRFLPTCSQYAQTAFCRFGFGRAAALTLWRVLRCHPFYRGPRYDPVPEK